MFMRIAFMVFLVAVWLLIDYPTGFWLFVYGGVLYWVLRPMLRPSHRETEISSLYGITPPKLPDRTAMK